MKNACYAIKGSFDELNAIAWTDSPQRCMDIRTQRALQPLKKLFFCSSANVPRGLNITPLYPANHVHFVCPNTYINVNKLESNESKVHFWKLYRTLMSECDTAELNST